MHALLTETGTVLEAWGSTGAKACYYRNPATHILAGTLFSREVYESDFLVALERLRKCGFVGLQGAFDTSVLVLARKLGWKHVFYQQRNVTRPEIRLHPTAAHTQEIKNNLWMDYRLYEVAQDLFEAACRPYGSHLQESVHQYSELQKARLREAPETSFPEYLVGEPLDDPTLMEERVPINSPLRQWMEACASGPTW